MRISIGDRIRTINFGWAEAVTDSYTVEGKASRGGLVDVKFDDTGNIRKAVYGNAFNLGYIRDGAVILDIKEGSVFRTINDGFVIVQDVINSRDMKVKFIISGNIETVQKDAMLRGLIKDRPKHEKIAEALLLEHSQGVSDRLEQRLFIAAQKTLIIEGIRAKRLEAQEKLKSENYNKWVLKQEADKVREDRNKFLIAQSLTYEIVDNNQHKTTKGVLDIDFKDRDGLWVLRYMRDNDFIQTRLGKLHNNMTQRANIGGSYQDKFTKSYVGVSASKLFSDPQKFCDWAVAQVGWGLGYHLDKDLLIEGNREYSENACCFLPRKINISLALSGKSSVSKRTGLYKAHGCFSGETIDFGNYESEDEAIEACQSFKRNMLTKYANEFKENISEAAYERLTNF